MWDMKEKYSRGLDGKSRYMYTPECSAACDFVETRSVVSRRKGTLSAQIV